jgi:hypothetical protein
VLQNNISSICPGDSAQICAPSGFANYQWNEPRPSADCIWVKAAGNYYVTVTDNSNCTAESNRASIAVFPPSPVSITVKGDTLTAYGHTSYQWFFNNAPISGATGDQYIVPAHGFYFVQVTDTNGCKATSQPVSIIMTGIGEMEDAGIQVYPNPSANGWQLTVDSKYIGSTLEIYNTEGRLVFQSEIRNSQSEITLDISTGVYFLRISSGDGSVVKKLVKL